MLQAQCHDRNGWEVVTDLTSISELRRSEGRLLWVESDTSTITEGDIGLITEEFGLHPLAIEDAMKGRERPKIEQYESHLFVILHQLDMGDGQLEAAQISCFIGARWVLILHEHAERTLAEARTRLRTSSSKVEWNPAFLMHTLIDTIVDENQTYAEDLEQEIELLEEAVLENPSTHVQREIYSVKQRLARFRRYVLPVSRMLATVVEPGRPPVIDDMTSTYFRDIYDHTLRISDQIRNIDDLTTAILDLIRTEQNHQQADATKRLSAWAAIIAAPTLISGIYGMNFLLFPAQGHIFGFWFAIGLMSVTSVGLYWFFKRRSWL